MKNNILLIDSLYAVLAGVDPANSFLGMFDTTTKAVAFNEVPIEYKLPVSDKCFIVYSLESIQAKQSETRTQLTDTILKIFISGDTALELASLIQAQLDGVVISSFHCSLMGINIMPNNTITIRFNLI